MSSKDDVGSASRRIANLHRCLGVNNLITFLERLAYNGVPSYSLRSLVDCGSIPGKREVAFASWSMMYLNRCSSLGVLGEVHI